MHIQGNINNAAMIASAQTTSKTGLEKPFPKHWGNPPYIQTCDWVELPDGFGFGSSTLRFWISDNLKNDAISNSPEANQIDTTSLGS